MKRCLKRIDIFKKSIGDNEAILGEITDGIIDIALDLKLKKKEREKK